MQDDNEPKPLDVAAFTLAGNTLLKLVENNVLPIDDAVRCLETTRNAFNNEKELRKTDIDEHLDNLKAILEANR